MIDLIEICHVYYPIDSGYTMPRLVNMDGK